MIENAYREGTTEVPAVASLPGAVCQDQKTSPTSTVTTSGPHPDVSVHVEQDGSAATASARQHEHSGERAAASDDKAKQSVAGEQGVCAKCECKCIARLKSRLKSFYYSFKLSIMGKLVFSLLAFLVPYDVVTDIIATWELYSSGHGWWGLLLWSSCTCRYVTCFYLS
jgi:hypothetical protein